jgi:heat shock protein HslJ
MRMMIAGLFALLGACTTASAPPGEYVGAWQLRMIGDRPTVAAPHPAMLMLGPDGSANGNGGCNAFGGRYVRDANLLTFSHMISTMMACASATGGDEIMTQERAMASILGGTVKERVEADTLTLTAIDGRTLHFVRAAPQ